LGYARQQLVEAKISSAFVEHISLAAVPLGVSVSVANGKVTLSGTTSNGSVRMRAERIAHDIAGVCHIDNRILYRVAAARSESDVETRVHASPIEHWGPSADVDPVKMRGGLLRISWPRFRTGHVSIGQGQLCGRWQPNVGSF
jgi:hypothetical protein